MDNVISDEQLLREQAKIFPEVFQEIVIVSAEADTFETDTRTESYSQPVSEPQNYERHKIEYRYEKPKEKKNVISRAFGWSKNLVGLGDDEEEEEYELTETKVAIDKTNTASTKRHPYTSVARVN
ncbi:MAG: hypothetical protein GWO07_12225, partial [Candidatus Dadabacteria bacterium]|nr:hypothetical protein [Candidatus Dadabacteria bacterium]NIV42938.1 hypothetical protein [Candidatus Dadabacteria bacterium]NIX15997.1 hypothetical protein [Candidatus Dadabacteria bacterium]